jgi:fructose-1,6-bisphosphatase/inositol monophosphatase family enzyme
VPLVQEAGGVLLDRQLQPLTLESDGAVVCASSREVAAAAVAAMAGGGS